MNFKHLEHTKQQFNKTANEQERKGVLKYGQPLNPLDDYDWLDMAREEAVDEFKYLEAEKVKRDFAINKIRNLSNHSEILYWCDFMQGK